MTQVSAVREVGVTRTRKQAPSLRLPDAGSTAEITVAQAMQYCAQKMGLSSTQEAVKKLREGNAAACNYCHYSVAKQVASALGSLDEYIRAAYVFDYDATPEDVCFGDVAPDMPIHLLVWTERKTGALTSLVEALDRALASRLVDLIGRGPRAHVLDVQIVDDAEVENRMGYGALLSSLHRRPIKVWER